MTEGGEDKTKPVTTFAPPPTSAALTIAAWMGVSLYFFPTIDEPDASIFTNRVFPEILSIKALLGLRLLYTLIGFAVYIMAFLLPAITLTIPYRPQSKAPRIPFVLGGWKKQYPFTAWSWNVLAISFALSTYITYQVDQGQPVEPWVVRLAILTWEISAPMTLLIGAIVKYALWPAQIKASGHGATFLTPRALLQHNANVIMAVTEVALMGGLPIQFSHISLSILYGCSYVLFTWAIQMTWHGQGPAFLYFFMDTTLGTEHTIALYALLSVLMIFHGLFCGLESILHMVGNNLLAHCALAFALCALVCRFRD